ncbi:hypothetical protein EYF80_047677 [Liparis tanakae]|uniref:Uncharacterized protein n=1 Tax=Liparis tanakae TaxID=230148 RepID=A0A4Z2FMS8_9TELE|nr:hypothetical protein EYF80_047677 [Liparis tanakae]
MLIFMMKESTSSGEEAATAAIIAVHREHFGCPPRKAEISTQTNRKPQADISTQTGLDDDHDDTTTDIEVRVEEAGAMEAAATEEDPLNESYCVISEEFVEETANEEPGAWIINEDLVMESIVYKNIVFRTNRVKLSDVKNYDPEEESVNGREETEPDIASQSYFNQEESIIEEENDIEEPLPLEIFYSLPKVVADCVKLVFAAVPQSTGFASVNTGVPIAEEVTAEYCGEGAGVMSVDVLTETAKPQWDKIVLIEELPEDAVSSPDDAVQPESIPDECTTVERADVDVDEAEIYEEPELCAVFVPNDAELMQEAANDALSQELEPSNLSPQGATVDTGFPLDEEVITATTYVAISGEQEASVVIPEEQVETDEDAIEASSNGVEAVPERVEGDTSYAVEEPAEVPPTDATEEPEPRVSIQEELKDENVPPAEKPTDSDRVVSEEPVEESLSLLECQSESDIPMVILKIIEDEGMKEMMH